MHGASQSFTLAVFQICNSCSELDANIIVSQIRNNFTYICSACDSKFKGSDGKFITTRLGDEQTEIEHLKILLKSKKREEKIDDILI